MSANFHNMNAGRSNLEGGVTLVCATRDRVVELERLFESLANQSKKAFELILVDQNTDERLSSLIEKYSALFAIRRLSMNNIGIAAARNVALPFAQYRWVGFPDDDCWFGPRFMERLLSVVSRDEYDGVFVNWRDPSSEARIAFSFSPGKMLFDEGFSLVASICLFVKADALMTTGGFNEKFGLGPNSVVKAGEDQEVILRLLAGGYHIEKVPDLFVFHPIGIRPWDHRFLQRIQGQGACDVYFKKVYQGVFPAFGMLGRWLVAIIYNLIRLRKRNLLWYSHKLYGALRYGYRL